MLAELHNVTKSYRSDAGAVPVLNGISLTIAEGETVAITGPSGCGKSTLLNLLGALDQADSGEIRVANRDLTKLDAQQLAEFRNTTVGFVFQLHHLLPHLSARANVELAMIGTGRGKAERSDRARQLLGEVGLGDRADARPSELSGGERQRIAVARAVANEPRLLLADEPTGALDTVSGARVLDLMETMRNRRGTTMLVVSYDPAVAERASRELRLTDGQLAA